MPTPLEDYINDWITQQQNTDHIKAESDGVKRQEFQSGEDVADLVEALTKASEAGIIDLTSSTTDTTTRTIARRVYC